MFTREIKEAVIAAANIVGEDGHGKDGMTGYMVDLARHEKAIFGGFLRGVMGTQVSPERFEQPLEEYETVEEARAELKRLGITVTYDNEPELKLVDLEDVTKLSTKDSGEENR